MTLIRRILRLEGRSPARDMTGARERLLAYIDAIAARQPIDEALSGTTAAASLAELAVLIQGRRS